MRVQLGYFLVIYHDIAWFYEKNRLECFCSTHVLCYLEENIANNVREHGEFQLTSALDRLRKEEGFMGLVINGQRYDIGLPEHYLETMARFHMGETSS